MHLYFCVRQARKEEKKWARCCLSLLPFHHFFKICLKTVTKIPYLLLVMRNFMEINLILTNLAEKLKNPKFYTLTIERCCI